MARTAAQIAKIKDVKQLYDLTPAEIRKLKADPDKLRTVTEKMAHAARKQIARLEAAPMGSESPALVKLKASGAKLYTRGSTVSELQDTFNALREFRGKKTASVKGWNKLQEKTKKRVNQLITDENKRSEAWSMPQQKKFWKAYRQAAATMNLQKGESDVVQAKLRSIQAGGKRKTIAKINQFYGRLAGYTDEQINAMTKRSEYLGYDADGNLSTFHADLRSVDGMANLVVTWADVEVQQTGGLNMEAQQKYNNYKRQR